MQSYNSIYNEQQKQEYIEFESVNSKTLTNYFKRIAAKEQEYGKDIADMNYEEAKDTITSLNIRREETRGQVISLFRGYVNWAQLNGKTNNSNILNMITAESIDSKDIIQNRMIRNPEQLQEILDNSLDYVNYENRAKRDSLLFWLLYSGLTVEEVKFLKKDSLNREDKIVTTTDGRKCSVYDTVLMLWDGCCKMTYIEKGNGQMKNSRARSNNISEYIKYDLVDSDYLFRAVAWNNTNDKEPMSTATLLSIVAKVFQDIEGVRISPTNIRNSGICYKLYLLEKDGVEITPEIVAEYFGIEYEDRPHLMLNTRRWRIDYEDWKLAFDYI